MHKISKKFELDYGHRVWNQDLGEGRKNKCIGLHGHRGIITVNLTSQHLNQDMGIDFNHLKFFKRIIDEVFDHKMILADSDPLVKYLLEQTKTAEWTFERIGAIHRFVPDRKTKNDYAKNNYNAGLYEMLDSVVVINEVPTSENLCKYFGEIFKHEFRKQSFYVPDRVMLSYVSFEETPTSKAIYTEGDTYL